MKWKSFDDIEIICRECNQTMILESALNNDNCIFVCPECNGHIKLVSIETRGLGSDVR